MQDSVQFTQGNMDEWMNSGATDMHFNIYCTNVANVQNFFQYLLHLEVVGYKNIHSTLKVPCYSHQPLFFHLIHSFIKQC